MLKIIQLSSAPQLLVDDNLGNLIEFDYSKLQHNRNFITTKLAIGDALILDREKRKSLTYNRLLHMENPTELEEYFNINSILHGPEYSKCEILKYEEGDFFTNHIDTFIFDNHGKGEHKYTCLIFGTFEQEDGYFEGGELHFKHPSGLYDIKIVPSTEVNKNKYVAVIFSIDMYHEVLPIISGTRYILKKPLFTSILVHSFKIEPLQPTLSTQNVDALEDGGFQDAWGSSPGDY
jgi:hypothetical protein